MKKILTIITCLIITSLQASANEKYLTTHSRASFASIVKNISADRAIFTATLFSLPFIQAFEATSGEDTLREKLEKDIPELIEKYKVPAIGVALIEDGKLKWQKVYGELEKDRPAPQDAIFNTASIGKTFTALLVLKLVDSKQWNLDEPLANYWIDEDIKDNPWLCKLTTRHVLSHRTGFKNWRRMNPSQKLEFDFEPGTAQQYSGEGMEYLRRALETKFKKPYDRMIDSLIFKPLYMKSSQYWSDTLDRSKFAYSHDVNGLIYQNMDYNVGVSGAGNIHTTLEDLSKFGIYILEGAGLSPSLYQEMITHQGKEEGNAAFGLGWTVIKNLPSEEYVLKHGGDDKGVHSMLILLPKSKKGMIVFTNGDNGILVIDKLIKGLVDLSEKSNDPEAIALDNGTLDTYLGTYLQTDNRNLLVKREGNILKISGEGIPLMELTPTAKNKFYVKGFSINMEFFNDTKDNTMKMKIFQNDKHVMDAVRSIK
ncbi:MAG TPA: serine hydrolase domain-containing protein [Cytophagales bacterium]|nr:serine hydrolase domain-containing protein [Cytophagales bacterium]